MKYSFSPNVRNAYVAFTDKSGQPWLRFFCGNRFQHCSVHLQDDKGWTSIEGLAGYTEIIRHEVNADFDLPRMLSDQGMTVVKTKLRRDKKTKKILAPAFFSCVELAKRILGLRKPMIITPAQLYRQLVKMNGGAA